MTDYHDPSRYVKGLQQILISDKKRIGFLFGAGTSLAKKDEKSLCVPAIANLTNDVVKHLMERDTFKKSLKQIVDELGSNLTIETLLSNLELKKEVLMGTSKLNELDQEGFLDLIQEVQKAIRTKVSVHERYQHDMAKSLVQADFARWIAKAQRRMPVEIFTTNYDFLFELGLEHWDIPYYDGFTGSYNPFFNASSVEDMTFLPQQTKLWKIHGSLGWKFEEESGKVIRASSDEQDIFIYPSVIKYRRSKKQPYEALMDRLSNFLKEDDGLLIVCGYSFGDEHINARIDSALKANTSSHVIFLLYDEATDESGETTYLLSEGHPIFNMASSNRKISVYGMRSAIIGGKLVNWRLEEEPPKEDETEIKQYFDFEGGDEWTGKGRFLLPDFSHLTSFLNAFISEYEL